jgi:hypothetical protein
MHGAERSEHFVYNTMLRVVGKLFFGCLCTIVISAVLAHHQRSHRELLKDAAPVQPRPAPSAQTHYPTPPPPLHTKPSPTRGLRTSERAARLDLLDRLPGTRVLRVRARDHWRAAVRAVRDVRAVGTVCVHLAGAVASVALRVRLRALGRVLVLVAGRRALVALGGVRRVVLLQDATAWSGRTLQVCECVW